MRCAAVCTVQSRRCGTYDGTFQQSMIRSLLTRYGAKVSGRGGDGGLVSASGMLRRGLAPVLRTWRPVLVEVVSGPLHEDCGRGGRIRLGVMRAKATQSGPADDWSLLSSEIRPVVRSDAKAGLLFDADPDRTKRSAREERVAVQVSMTVSNLTTGQRLANRMQQVGQRGAQGSMCRGNVPQRDRQSVWAGRTCMRYSVLQSLKTHAEGGREGGFHIAPARSWPVSRCLPLRKGHPRHGSVPWTSTVRSGTEPDEARMSRNQDALQVTDCWLPSGILAVRPSLRAQRRFSVPRVADLRSLGRKPFERASFRGPFRATAVTAQPRYNAFPKRPEASTPERGLSLKQCDNVLPYPRCK